MDVPSLNVQDKQSGVLARMKKGLLGLTGAERSASWSDSSMSQLVALQTLTLQQLRE